jgi:glycerate 2-kinase
MVLNAALAAVDPEPLTRDALQSRSGPVTLVAIGKGAAAMCRGAALALGPVSGICVSSHEDPVPDGVELILGDHPIPGARSFRAGQRVIEAVAGSRHPIVVLLSGGGSSLCEQPVDGVSTDLIVQATRALLDAGASIADTNLVRRHLSAIKGGGLTRVAGTPLETYALSDVCGADPSVIASGPTSPQPRDHEAALDIMSRYGIRITEETRIALSAASAPSPTGAHIEVLADGRTAAEAAADGARAAGFEASVQPGWIHGDAAGALDRFFSSAPAGRMTIATGEPEVEVTGDGIGGRNTHVALLAAERITDTEAMFCAFATDGVDGNSRAAGAIVAGDTLERGGDHRQALANSDAATYLESTGDLIVTGPTGTNVSDLWLLWR